MLRNELFMTTKQVVNISNIDAKMAFPSKPQMIQWDVNYANTHIRYIWCHEATVPTNYVTQEHVCTKMLTFTINKTPKLEAKTLPVTQTKLFSTVLKHLEVNQHFWLLDLNRDSLLSQAPALPTVPQLLSNIAYTI